MEIDRFEIRPKMRRDFESLHWATINPCKEAIEMRILKLSLITAAVALGAASASAEMRIPTEAQKEALRTDCREDFIAHCEGVSPGGIEAFDCLVKNEASLSESCQGAVKAVDPEA